MSRGKAGARFTALAVAAMLVVGGAVAGGARPAQAAGFDAGNIISDAKFFDGGALSTAGVQSVLDSKVGTCRASSGSPSCLKSYRSDISARASRAGRCAEIYGASNQTAATVIARVGKACGISQKALLVLLEKEQGLVTATAPSAGRYRIAMGFGCPDTAACDTTYYGFFNQVYSAALQFKTYAATPNSWNYRAGRTNSIQYHPNAACGSKNVYIANQATAGLYIYTPYTPNAASLANPRGSGDACSSYGNRNFWQIYSDWFESPVSGSSPIGGADLTNVGGGNIRVQGWTIDPDVVTAIPVHVYVDGVGAAAGTADAWRPDVGSAYPKYGDRHGIDLTVKVPAGTHSVCVFGIDSAGQANTLLLCGTVVITSDDPFGGMDVVAVPNAGKVQVNGWVIDPNTSSPVRTKIFVDGALVADPLASADRPDVGAAYPGFGSGHGIDAVIAATKGTHRVCVRAIDQGPGADTSLGCARVEVNDRSPFGGMDVTTGDLSVRVTGWTIDPDVADPIDVHVYVDDAGTSAKASASRPDVGAVYPWFGSNHGIDVTVPASAGSHSVCAYGINVRTGSNTLLGCQTVQVRRQSPFGAMDAHADGDRIIVGGWTMDPDTKDPIDVHVYVDGVGAASKVANALRRDVGLVYPYYGNYHGIDVQLTGQRGTHSVCAFGINVGQGTNTLLGCQDVVIP